MVALMCQFARLRVARNGSEVKWEGLFLLPLLLLVICSSSARAGFDEQLAINAKALALANSVTANPPGVMAIHYNPAGLSLLSGTLVSQGVTLPVIEKTGRFTADPDFEGFLGGFSEDPLAGTEGTNTSGRMHLPVLGDVDTLVTPALGFSYRKPGSRWTWAIGNYAPFGVGVVHGDPDDPMRFGGQAIGRQHLIYAAPAVSYQLSDSLSIGLSVGLGQTAVSAGMDMRAPNDLVALTRVLGDATKDLEVPILSELTLPPPWFGGGVSPYDRLATIEMSVQDDFSPSWNLGLLWQPLGWFACGVVYQSEISSQVTGDYSIEYSEAWRRMVQWFGSSPLLITTSGVFDLPTNPVPRQQGTVVSEVAFPQRVQLGIKLSPMPWLRLMVDMHWADWSVVDQERFEFDQVIQLLQLTKMLGYTGGDKTLVLERNWKDTLEFSYGLEVQPLDWLTLRFGYQQRKSAVPDANFDLIYALPDLDYYATGFGIELDNGVQIDLGFGYLVNASYRIADGVSRNLNSTDVTKPVYNPYAGLDYEQETKTYLGSLNVTVPLKMVTEMMTDQLRVITHLAAELNPFD